MKLKVPTGPGEGQHVVTVTGVEVREFDNKFNEETRPVAAVEFEGETEDEEPFTVKYYPTVNWNRKSKWVRLLAAAQLDVSEGDDFDTDDLVGSQMVITIEHVVDDEGTRYQITDVQQLEE